MRSAWVLGALGVAGAAVATSGDAGAAETRQCALRQVTSLPMTGLERNQVEVPIGIKGQEFPSLLDTGAQTSVISQAVVQQMDLRTEDLRVAVTGVDGQPLKFRASIPDYRLGNIRASSFWLPVSPGTRLGGGLLGRDILSQYDVEIDPAGKKVNLFSKDHCPGQVVYWASEFYTLPFTRGEDDSIEVSVQLDGRRLTGVLDTGATNVSIESGVARKLGVTAESPNVKVETVTGGVGNGAVDMFSYQFDSLVLDTIKISHPMVVVYKGKTFRQTNLGTHIANTNVRPDQLLLGMNVMKKFRFYISYDESIIYFTPI